MPAGCRPPAAERPIVLMWDNATCHTDAAMRALIATGHWLTVFRLPAYAPDLNPAERVWSHLKKEPGQPRATHHWPAPRWPGPA